MVMAGGRKANRQVEKMQTRKKEKRPTEILLRLKRRRLLETRVSEVNFYFEHSWESGRKKMAGAVDDRDGRGPPEDIWQRARKIFENGRQRTESAPAASFQSLDKK